MSLPLDELAMNQLQSQQSELLDKIDELRTMGVGSLVELPQIIVCGNQSSGKSSVLEAISRVRFPASGKVCTRFATEVVLRRSPHAKTKVSIEPGDSRKDEQERRNLQTFRWESPSDHLHKLIAEAQSWMGLSSTDPSNAGFSDDVLKIEISGPEKPELTLVDLPGLYVATSGDQTAEGMKIVENLTKKYMRSPRSIILAVISAKGDYHMQKVLNMAHQFDPKYERVLGIVTQPDMNDAGSEEEETYLQFIRNEKIKLQLGWHVLRNRSHKTSRSSDEERDAIEKEFFEQGRWASLPRGHVGIDSLRHRLSNILLSHVRRNLPGLITDIQGKIWHHEQELAKMGVPRSTIQDQRQFLIGISSRFERITNQALNGSYVDDFFGGFKDRTVSSEDFRFRRLRAVMRELNEYFAEAMSIRGSRRIIQVWGQSGFVTDTQAERSNPYMVGWTPQYISRVNLEEEIKEQARESRGIELPGSANQLLVGSLFRDQCKPWEALARSHLLNACRAVEYFINLALRHITDDLTRPLLMRHVISPELEKMKGTLLEKLGELTSYSKSGHPLPIGKTFLSKVQECRKNREVAGLKSNLGLSGGFGSSEKNFNAMDLERAASQLQLSSDQFAAAEIIDQMQAYYETAIVTFVDNIAILAIENCLLRPLENILTGQTVLGMDEDKIREIATEPENIQKDRKRLDEELRRLREGQRTLCAFNSDGSSLQDPPILAGRQSSKAEIPIDQRKFKSPAISRPSSGKDTRNSSLFNTATPAPSSTKESQPSLFSKPSNATGFSGSLFTASLPNRSAGFSSPAEMGEVDTGSGVSRSDNRDTGISGVFGNPPNRNGAFALGNAFGENSSSANNQGFASSLSPFRQETSETRKTKPPSTEGRVGGSLYKIRTRLTWIAIKTFALWIHSNNTPLRNFDSETTRDKPPKLKPHHLVDVSSPELAKGHTNMVATRSHLNCGRWLTTSYF